MYRSQLVKLTAAKVTSLARHVQIDHQALASQVESWVTQGITYSPFEDFDCHLTPAKLGDEAFIDYIFVLDSLNFCFWPLPDFEYDHLSGALKRAILENKDCFQPHNLLKLTLGEFHNKIFDAAQLPLLEERFRLLQDAAQVAVKHFEGKFLNVVLRAQGSCQQLLEILTSYFLGFQDHSIYRGQQVYFYKRAQILIADIYGAYSGQGIGQFKDIDELTTFPDYRVPQILNQLGILMYSAELAAHIKNQTEIESGTEFEIEIRAFTVVAVEEIRKEFAQRGRNLLSIEVDWLLWQIGEKERKGIIPHHRTLTIYY